MGQNVTFKVTTSLTPTSDLWPTIADEPLPSAPGARRLLGHL